MEWTTEAVNAQIAYRRGDLVARRHLREVHGTRPRWWRRLRLHRSEHGNGDHRAA